MNWKYIKGGKKDFVGAPEWAEKVIRGNHASSSSFIGELGGIKLVACENKPEAWYEFNDGFLHSVIAQREPVTDFEPALAASEGWIEWGGGECPIDEAVRVDLKYRDGRSQSGEGLAQDWRWWHGNNCSDIIAYRLHKPDINSRANDGLLEQDLNECIGASEAQVWNGEGVPPIGCACEMQDSKGAWLPVEIIAKNDGFTFGWSYDYRLVFFGDKADEFRPLHTEAEKAREADINAMLGVVTNYNKTDVIHAIEQLYDAGYRKEVK